MLYRLLAGSIVVFWIAMTALLVRKEIGPGDSSLRSVPVEHVARMMLQREQSSDLQLYNEKTIIGHLRIQPRVRPEDGQREFDASGWMQVALPGSQRQRVAWTSEFDVDAALAAERAKATVNLREPSGYLVDLLVDFARRRVSFEAQLGSETLRRTEYSLNEAGAQQWMRDQGLDPALLASLPRNGATHVEMHAQQSTLELRGEKIETYLITAEQSGQTLIEAHISQLGQILRVRTIFGYSAAPEEMAP